MRVLSREALLAMPAGTIYAEFGLRGLDELAIKGDLAAGIDFPLEDLVPWFVGAKDTGAYLDTMERLIEGAAAGLVHNVRIGRLGRERLFAVLDLDDVAALVAGIAGARRERSGASL